MKTGEKHVESIDDAEFFVYHGLEQMTHAPPYDVSSAFQISRKGFGVVVQKSQ